MGDWSPSSLFAQLINLIAEGVLAALNALWDLLASTVFTNPDVTGLPQVEGFAGRSLLIVNAVYVLAFLWAALLIMGRGQLASPVEAGELVPRLVLGLLGANFALPLCSWLITSSNTATGALTGQPIASPESLQLLRATVVAAVPTQNQGAPAALLMLLLALLIAVLVGTLVVQYITRIGLLVVLAGVAPLALAMHGTPQTEAVAKLWWRTLGGVLATVMLQAVALHTALTVFLNPDTNYAVLGLPGEFDATMNLLVVLCLFWGIIRIPRLLSHFVTQPRPGRAVTVLRVLLVQQLTRTVRRSLGLSGGRRDAHRSAAGTPGRRPAPAAPRSLPAPRTARPRMRAPSLPARGR
ncbi:conjugal transfer protein TrbL family protein [Dactylosporangium sp. NPDC051541]|uniref:conjugal transfer protein TrbL family protein n=1 Tax=Dactylosporangium sp. NPDC051541 TaxID=3363977 RepID=UPI0037A1889D